MDVMTFPCPNPKLYHLVKGSHCRIIHSIYGISHKVGIVLHYQFRVYSGDHCTHIIQGCWGIKVKPVPNYNKTNPEQCASLFGITLVICHNIAMRRLRYKIPTNIVTGVMKHHRILQILLGCRPIISSILSYKRRHPEENGDTAVLH